ncbi:hypothetical protein DFH06DRAFT_1255244 [Mycena polygramma]|nr:hypothetical protein DFH06DRAFT_1255244 [Mycena polygramma]
MGRTPSAAAAKKATAGTKKSNGRKKVATAEFGALQSQKAAVHDEFSKSKRTKATYQGYVDRAKDIIADLVKERREKLKADPGWRCPEGIDTDLLAKALEGTPNKHSAIALELCITQKCIVEGLSKSTAEGLHARAPQIQSLVKCIKNKSRVKGEAATRRHAEATTIEDMRAMMSWSESQCSADDLEKCAPKDLQALLVLLKHGMVRSFLSSGYNLWTRNFELCQLQERDLTPDARGPAPYYLPVLSVFLDNRKGWQSKQGFDGPLKSNHYDIYEQKDTPEICMYTHFMRWRAVYRQRLGREFEPTDYVFPYIAPNGIIHPKKPLSHDLVQDYINEFASGANIHKNFTTHCLRRGGSQYRFMFAALGKRWSLTIIRWWGGWAEGEQVVSFAFTTQPSFEAYWQVDTLMRYLLDSLQSYESGHGDALNPYRLEADKSFMGDHDALKTPTVAEFRTLSETMLTKLDNISANIHSPQSSPNSAMSTAFGYMSLSPAAVTGPSNPTSQVPSQNPSHPAQLPGREATPMDQDAPTSIAMPLPGVLIPSIGRDARAWRQAVDQWEVGDSKTGLMPLKDWPVEYYTGAMRLVTGTLYSNRKLIAMEYRRLGSDDRVFKDHYPEHTKITKLMTAIRAKSGRMRT